MHPIGTGPYTADIGDGIETFETLADVQSAMRARVSGIRSSSEWYRQMRSRHGAKVRDAARHLACGHAAVVAAVAPRGYGHITKRMAFVRLVVKASAGSRDQYCA